MRHLNIIAAILITTTVISLKSNAQNTFPSSGAVGIGTTTPDASSLLEVKSTTKGVLFSRMTKAQRDAIASPAQGLMVYVTDKKPGLYYYEGSWKEMKGATKSLDNLTDPTAINVNLYPGTTATTDLGSSTLRWRDAYINNIKFSDGTTLSTASGGGAETDPQVGTNTTNYIPRWNGSALVSGFLQDDGTKLYTVSGSIWNYAKATIEQSSNDNTLNLVNEKTGTGTTQGIYNIMYGTGGATGSKTGIRNEVSMSSSGTGFVKGTENSISSGGSGLSYGTYNYVSNTGTGGIYGTYSTLTTNNNSAPVYGDYKTISSAGGNTYGNYTTMSGGGTMWGHYINLPTTSGGNKYGVYVNAPCTTGINYGIYSTVVTTNPNSYAGYFHGQLLCDDKAGFGTSGSLTVKLQVDNGTDVEPGSGGYFISGNVNSSNIAMDNNEIMARNNGATSTLYLNNDGGNVAMCVAGGNVTIGTSTPATGYKFSVYGKIMCEELKVQLHANWPDYVFDENYSMPSISELKSFVNEHKHLPGIPSAAEMKESGISVGDMQTKMMQKIEELSLYIIQLQTEIDELKAAKN